MVYVINKNGNPLMPCKEAKARHLLSDKKAKVVKKVPFTIQLLFDCEENVQPISLGIDAGSKHIGVSATTENKVLYEADVELRNDIVDLISTKREVRRTRRNVTLEPMSAQERRIIHSEVQEIEGITTFSVGQESNRKVVVALDKKTQA